MYTVFKNQNRQKCNFIIGGYWKKWKERGKKEKEKAKWVTQLTFSPLFLYLLDLVCLRLGPKGESIFFFPLWKFSEKSSSSVCISFFFLLFICRKHGLDKKIWVISIDLSFSLSIYLSLPVFLSFYIYDIEWFKISKIYVLTSMKNYSCLNAYIYICNAYIYIFVKYICFIFSMIEKKGVKCLEIFNFYFLGVTTDIK